jgi:hypothetical protein
MKRIQYLNKQNITFRLLIDGIECYLIRTSLYVGNDLTEKNAVVKGSTLGWNFPKGFVSYWAVKKAITDLPSGNSFPKVYQQVPLLSPLP